MIKQFTADWKQWTQNGNVVPPWLSQLSRHNKMPQAGELQQQTFISQSSGGSEVQDQGWLTWFLVRACFLACSLLSSHMACSLCVCEGREGRERERERVSKREHTSFVVSYKNTNSIMGAPSSWPYLNLMISQGPHFLIMLHCWLGFQHMYCRGTVFIPQHPLKSHRAATAKESINKAFNGEWSKKKLLQHFIFKRDHLFMEHVTFWRSLAPEGIMIANVHSSESDSLRKVWRVFREFYLRRKKVQYSILEWFLSVYFKYWLVYRWQSIMWNTH